MPIKRHHPPPAPVDTYMTDSRDVKTPPYKPLSLCLVEMLNLSPLTTSPSEVGFFPPSPLAENCHVWSWRMDLEPIKKWA